MESADGLNWKKATLSASQGNCVEVGTVAGRAAGIRDSKSPERGHLAVSAETFGQFLAGVKDGQFEM